MGENHHQRRDLGGSHDISRENIQKLIDLRGFYRVTGRHPGYKKYDNGLR